MIAKSGSGLLDFAIVLCDGSKGLGSIQALRNVDDSAADMHTQHHHSHHGESDDDRQTGASCADCDLTWASCSFDDAVADTGELHTLFHQQRTHFSTSTAEALTRKHYSYQSRAPPALPTT
jgi:hypothetical protein